MGKHLIEDTLYLYENNPTLAISEYRKNSLQHEYILDRQEARIRAKLIKYLQSDYSKSPEEIIIEREEHEKIMHFLMWIKEIVSQSNKENWEMFCDLVMYDKGTKYVCEKYDKTPKQVSNFKANMRGKIQKYIPYYNEQYGDLIEYLRM